MPVHNVKQNLADLAMRQKEVYWMSLAIPWVSSLHTPLLMDSSPASLAQLQLPWVAVQFVVVATQTKTKELLQLVSLWLWSANLLVKPLAKDAGIGGSLEFGMDASNSILSLSD